MINFRCHNTFELVINRWDFTTLSAFKLRVNLFCCVKHQTKWNPLQSCGNLSGAYISSPRIEYVRNYRGKGRQKNATWVGAWAGNLWTWVLENPNTWICLHCIPDGLCTNRHCNLQIFWNKLRRICIQFSQEFVDFTVWRGHIRKKRFLFGILKSWTFYYKYLLFFCLVF